MAGRYQKRSDGAAAVRNLAIVFGLGVASFVLGFFVLAKMLPSSHTSASTASPPPSTETPPVSASKSGVPSSAASSPASLPSPHVSPPPAESGPLLTTEDKSAAPPSDETKPIQGASDPPVLSDKKSGDHVEVETRRAETGSKSETPPSEETVSPGKTDEARPAEDPPPRRRRRKRSHEALQSPSTPDEARSDARVSVPKETGTETLPSPKSSRRTRAGSEGVSESAETTNTGSATKRLYRVQVNVYASEAAARQEVDVLQDKHVRARVRKVVREGKTYYSVQHGAFSSKEKAQTAKDKLKEQGIEGYITER